MFESHISLKIIMAKSILLQYDEKDLREMRKAIRMLQFNSLLVHLSESFGRETAMAEE